MQLRGMITLKGRISLEAKANENVGEKCTNCTYS